MQNISSAQTLIVTVKTLDSKTLYLAPRTATSGREQLHILMERRETGWQPVTQLRDSINRYRFQDSYGFMPMNSRNENAIIGSGLQYLEDQSTFIAGEEVALNDNGDFVINRKQIEIPKGRKPSQSERTEVLEIHYDDSEWSVATA